MTTTRPPITAKGFKALQEELNKLKKVDRPNVIKAIAEARAHGDLKENAEYHAAREQQSFLEGRIAHLEELSSSAQVIDITKIPNNGKIIFGSTVELINLETEQQIIYQIVSDYEADIKAGKISINSPIARGLIGKEVGDVVTIKAPSGNIEYEITDVNY